MSEAIRKYQPSNGTEGEAFMSAWCNRCDKDTPEKHCEIIGWTMALRVEDPAYPSAWRYNDAGRPICTEYVNAAEAEKARAQARYDALPRDPVTGRPVIA